MAWNCNNKCQREDFKTEFKLKYGLGGKPKEYRRNEENKHKRPYLNGYKRCKTCEIFVITDLAFCPCCTRKFKTSRNRATNKPSYPDIQEYKPVKQLMSFKFIEQEIRNNTNKLNEILAVVK